MRDQLICRQRGALEFSHSNGIGDLLVSFSPLGGGGNDFCWGWLQKGNYLWGMKLLDHPFPHVGDDNVQINKWMRSGRGLDIRKVPSFVSF